MTGDQGNPTIGSLEPVLTVLALGFLLTLTAAMTAPSLSRSASWALATAALSVWAVARSTKAGIVSGPGVYLLVFMTFHLGVAPLVATGRDVPTFGNPRGADWVVQLPTAEALRVVTAAVLGFALVVRLMSLGGGRHRERSGTISRGLDRRTAQIALALVGLGVTGWFAFVVDRGGLGALTGSYGAYLEETAGGLLPQLYLLLSLGAVLAAARPDRREARWAAVLLAAFGVFGVVLGLRGEVLFPAAAALAVLVRSGRARPTFRWVLVAVLLLSGISGVRSLRAEGIGSISVEELDLNPVNGLAEMGYSLRPVGEVLSWEDEGDPFLGGRTFAQPLRRAASRVLPVDVPPADEDPLLMNTRILDEVGPIGFSPVAEGYVNFGLAGAVGYLMLVAGALTWLDRRADDTSGQVVLGLVLVPLLIQTRNSFVPIPLHLSLVLVLWMVVRQPGRSFQPRGRPGRRQLHVTPKA